MSSRLLIRINPDDSLSWLLPSDGTRGNGAPPKDLLAAADEVAVLVPGESVLLIRAELPPGNRSKLSRVLPFALEDRLLDDVETLHFALGDRHADGWWGVAVVARERLDAWLQGLAGAGITADVLIPDTLAVPHTGEGTTVLLEPSRCVVREGRETGFVCAPEQLQAWLPTSGDFDLWPTESSVSGFMPAHGQGQLHPPAVALDVFARGVGETPSPNLLQGDFAPRHRRAPQRRLWRIAAMFAAAAVLVGLAGQAIDVLRLRVASQEADAAIARSYADMFPDSPPVPDPVARVRSELQRLGGGTDDHGMLSLLSRMAPILASHDFRLHMLGLEYRNASLELSVQAPDLGNLDQLRERLATLPGISVELTAATPGEKGVEGRLRIKEAGA